MTRGPLGRQMAWKTPGPLALTQMAGQEREGCLLRVRHCSRKRVFSMTKTVTSTALPSKSSVVIRALPHTDILMLFSTNAKLTKLHP